MEKADLRRQFLQQFRGSVNSVIMNVTIHDHGVDVTPEKLKRKQGQMA